MNLLALIAIVVLVAAGIFVSILSWKIDHHSNPEQTTWPRDLKLLRWSPGNYWTLDQATAGVLCTGTTNSGKTTGPFNTVVRSLLRSGASGAFLVAKNDAAREYIDLIRSEGRESDLIVFSPETPNQGFNFLAYEVNQSGSDRAIVENLVRLLMEAVEISARHRRNQGHDWFEDAMQTLLRNCLLVVMTTTGKPDIGLVLEMVQSLPQSLGDVEEPERFRSLQLLDQAESKATPERAYELQMARRYITWEWTNLSDRTRSSIAISLSTPLDVMLRWPLKKMFLEELTVSPDDPLAGRLVVIDVPVKRHDLIGKISGVIWKYSFQRAIERRPEVVNRWPVELVRPCFIGGDEIHFFSTHNDSFFQSTARSSRGISVYATQSIANFTSEMGGDPTSKARVDSLLANLQTRFACQNLDPETNKWYSDSLGNVLVKRRARSVTVNPNGGGFLAKLAGANRSINQSESEQPEPDLSSRQFSGLKTGGFPNKGIVEAILSGSGARLLFRQRWKRVSFDQFNPPKGLRKFFTRHVVINVPRKKG